MKKILGYPLMALVLTACVTINIYFPAAAAEEAARTIVRDVLKAEEGAVKPEGDATTPPDGDKSSEVIDANPLLIVVGRLLEVIVPTAEAAEADININTPAIGAIRASMQRRQGSLAPLYKSGAIGFADNGSVAVRDMNAVPLPQRNQVKKLVADENADRTKLYREIAKENGHPEWEGKVRGTFAKVWVQEAPGGYFYQQGGGWKQK
ncbi:DUF1318 domain-containing protein [Thiosocius teredinicola]|uniref:DUF1318 domain-containing protein n=1 Tax=Thiosocius teredinicola TaxID=1973002 RepID=UPI000990DA5B